MKRRLAPVVAAAAMLGLYAACSDNPTAVQNSPPTARAPMFEATSASNGPGACMGDDAVSAKFINGLTDPLDLNCTANDIDIAHTDVTAYRLNGSGTDPFTPLTPGDSIECVPGDVINLETIATLQNNAQSRYDIGIWIGEQSQANALHGSCLQFNLVKGVLGVADLDTLPGTNHGDQCGDMEAGKGNTPSTTQVSLDTLTVTCANTPSHTVSLPACVGWQNSIGNLDPTDPTNRICPTTPPGGQLGFRYGTTPETKSKCNCEPMTFPIIVKASLTLVKVLTNNSGGTKTLSDFPLTATGPNTISGTSGTTAVTKRAVDAGSYALSEQTQAGYTPSTWSCTGDGTQSGANIALGQGGVATCTISNDDQPATLTLVKVLTNDNGGSKTLSDFPLTASGPSTISGTSGTTAVTGQSVKAGSYALSEQSQAGYTASTWSCTGNGSLSGANLTLGLNGAATCTISNDDQPATLTLVKVLTNNSGGTKTLSDFPLTASGPSTISGTSGTTAVTGQSVKAGSYALSEQAQVGYDASTWSCTGDGTQSGANITLGLNGAATCTISNDDQPATLTLVKVLTNNSGGTKTLSDFPLTAAGPSTISGTSGTTAVTGQSVKAGSYALSEQAQTGYTASTWSCSGNGTLSGANLALGLGGAATCTISNDDQPATLTLVKVVTNNSGGTKTLSDFPLTAAGPSTISGTSGTTAVTGQSVKAGSYALSEQAQAGYSASSWSCTGFDASQVGSTLQLNLGGTATCTISNDDQGATLTLVKVVTNNSGGTKTLSDFPLTAAGPTTISGTSGTGSVTNQSVNAGIYALSEQSQAGYTPSSWSCTGDGTLSGANFTLPLNGAATCTISNDDQPAKLTLVKVLTNNSGGTKSLSDFPLTADGPSNISGTSGTGSVTNQSVKAGIYALSEQSQAGYTASTWSCSGDGSLSGANFTLPLNGAATCTISNDDQPATLTLVKVVTNNSGGTKTLSDFPLTATGPSTISGTSGTSAVTGQSVKAGSYALSEQSQTGYTASTWSCSGDGTLSGANFALPLAGAATCTISNDDQPATLTLVKVVTNDNGGTKTLSDFPLTATGPTNISGVSGTTSVTSRAVNAGSYALSEQTQSGYTPSTWSCSGGTQTGANIALGLGGSATCTISNDDIPQGNGQILPTESTCQDFIAGADALTALLAQLRGGKINSTAPGVFFYYAQVIQTTAGPIGFTQWVQPGLVTLPLYQVQQAQAYLYNTSCTKLATLQLNSGLTAGTTTTNFPVGTYILGVKFETGAAKGLSVPGSPIAGTILSTHHFELLNGASKAQVNTVVK